jgi:hypothetical protein
MMTMKIFYYQPELVVVGVWAGEREFGGIVWKWRK